MGQSLEGQRVGPWVLLEHIGSGGMGDVWMSRHAHEQDQIAAVKVCRTNNFDAPKKRFVREARALEQLDHPAIVRFMGSGESDDGYLYLAMEHAAGDTLSKRIRRGPMPVHEALIRFRVIAAGLAHAHERGLFHRDLKPSNIMVGEQNSVKILDFGNALEEGEDDRLTREGAVSGTAPYLPPEALDGGGYDPRFGDVYAVGVVLWEALTGSRAFSEPKGERTRFEHASFRERKGSALALDEVFPAGVRALVGCATEPDPGNRFADMGAMSAALSTALEELQRVGGETTLPTGAVQRSDEIAVAIEAVESAPGPALSAPPSHAANVALFGVLSGIALGLALLVVVAGLYFALSS